MMLLAAGAISCLRPAILALAATLVLVALSVPKLLNWYGLGWPARRSLQLCAVAGALSLNSRNLEPERLRRCGDARLVLVRGATARADGAHE
jgi:ABC-type cobalamin transport system permease subunit